MIFLPFAIIIFVILVDQITKNAVLSAIGVGGQPIVVIERFFYIVCHRNSGAAWGILKNGRLFFLIVTPLLLIAMLVFILRNKDTLLRVALAFVVGGAVGNYIDRLFVGSVVDFLDFYIFGYNFPTFNAADSAIVFGSALMVIYTFRYKKQPEPGDGANGLKCGDGCGIDLGGADKNECEDENKGEREAGDGAGM